MRKSSACFIALILTLVALAAAQQKQQDRAREYVQYAAQQMGGLDHLREIKTARIESLGHQYFLEQSERPDGPFIVAYVSKTEFRDYEHGSLRQDTATKSLGAEQGFKSSVTVSDGVAQANMGDKHRPDSPSQVDDAAEALDFSAHRLVLNALDATDLHALPDTTIHGEPCHVVAFSHDHLPVRLFLNAYTGLPGVVEWTRAYPTSVFWRVWGDVRNRQEFTNYFLLPGGLRLPLQLDLSRDDQAYRSEIITKLDLNPTIPPDTFAIAPDVKSAFEQRKSLAAEAPPIGKPRPIIEGDESLVLFAGAWNSTIIKQPDGLVILEAPIGPAHSRNLLEEARKRYPNAPIKGVITTSDAWPHFGGVREMVANSIPIYATDLNRPILTRFVNSPFTQSPDSLAKSPKPANFHWISAKTVIGTGPNRLEIYPIRNASGERFLMVYFPEHKLLYVSDLAQRQGDGTFFMPEYLKEVSDAAAREKFVVDNFFAMHMPVTPWSVLQQALAKATADQAPATQ